MIVVFKFTGRNSSVPKRLKLKNSGIVSDDISIAFYSKTMIR